MELYRGRPMAIIGSCALAAALLGWYLVGWAKLAIAALLCFALAVAVILRHRRRISGRAFATLSLCMLASACVLCRAYAYYDIDHLGSRSLCDSEHSFYLIVDERNYATSYSSKYTVRVRQIDGSEPRRTLNAYLLCESGADIEPGELIYCHATPGSFESYGGYSAERMALADGITMTLTMNGSAVVVGDLTRGGNLDLLSACRRLNTRLSVKLGEAVGGDAGALASAMLLGDRGGIDEALSRDFSRAGISHLLALSGLHLSVMAGGVELLLSRFRMPRTLRIRLMSAFLIFYLILTGLRFSAIRSAIMLFILYAAYYGGADGDGVSSVFLAATLILIESPYAVINIGFVLSFAATLGITLLVPQYDRYFNKKEKDAAPTSRGWRRVRQFAVKAGSLLLTGLAANCFTAIVIWWVFGEISVAAPLTNLCLTPLSAPFLYASALCLILSPVPVFGNIAAVCVRLLARLFINASAWVAAQPWAAVSLEYDFVPYIMIPAAVLTVILLAVRLKRRAICMLPAAAAAVCFTLCFFAVGGAGRQTEIEVGYIRSSQNDAIYAVCGTGAVLIDIGNGSYAPMGNAYAAAHDAAAVEIDAMVLTHYNKRHVSTVWNICGSETVRRLWLPMPQDSDEFGSFMLICEAAELRGVSCSLYEYGTPLAVFGDAVLTVDRYAPLGRSAVPPIGVELYCGERGNSLRYLTSSAWESESFAMSLSEPAAEGESDGKKDGTAGGDRGARACDSLIIGAYGTDVKTPPPQVLFSSAGRVIFGRLSALEASVGGGTLPADTKYITVCPEHWRAARRRVSILTKAQPPAEIKFTNITKNIEMC